MKRTLAVTLTVLSLVAAGSASAETTLPIGSQSSAADTDAPSASAAKPQPFFLVFRFKLVAIKTVSWHGNDDKRAQSTGTGAGKITFNPFSITKKK